MAAQSGCLYVSVLTERQLALGARKQIAKSIGSWRATLAGTRREALAACPAAPAIDADALVDHLFMTFEGAFILSRSMNDPRYMPAQLSVLRQLVEFLLHGGCQ